MIPFYYFYTPDYEFWNNHLSETLCNHFDVRPISIDKINLSNNGHHFTNVTIKIELLIDCIKKNMNNSILFTDATIFVNKNNVKLLQNYICEKINTNKDLYFLYLQQDPINIGVILLKCNETNLYFWEYVLKTMNEMIQNGYNAWDQGVVNKLIIGQKYPIEYGYFDSDKFWTGCKMNKENINNFFIYKSCVKPESDRQLIRLTFLYELNLITKDEYNFWLNYSTN
uniref:Nucleotide-diphospho-sugar transferase domain-containing protein n=1 Tax=viral metagenome TaxID=1070528 RepID=A0A6C0I0L7_9ZZZZ